MLAHDTIWRRPAALSSLYADLGEKPAMSHTLFLGSNRRCSMNRQGVAPALGDHQAGTLFEPRPAEILKDQFLKSFVPKSSTNEICDRGT